MQAKILLPSILGAALVLGASSTQAADRYNIDPVHSNIFFLVEHLGYSRMVGQFQDFSGAFVFDAQTPGSGSVEVTIKTASVDTDHDKRDDHLRSPDFFNAAEFPEMAFKSTSIEVTGDKTGKITGEVTLLGVTKPVTIDVTFNKLAPHPLPQYNGVMVAGFSGRGSLKRSDFGMKTFAPALGDEIEVWLEIEGHKS